MRKYVLTLCIALMSVCAFAQETSTKTSVWDKTKNFLGSLKYEIVVGYGGSSASEPFDEAKIIYNLGVTARKEVASFKDNKVGVYGIAGLFFTKRGGKTDNDIMKTFDSDKNFSVSVVSVPLHIGGEYKFKKVSIFADLGPTLVFKTSQNEEVANLETKAVALDVGYNIGVRFKRFAFSFGLDQDITSISKLTPDQKQKEELGILSEKESFDLKTGGLHIDLRWTL